MRRYIRAPGLGGASYFFTLTLEKRHDNDRLIRHVDALWRMPQGDGNYALRWRLIKSAFSRQVPRGETVSASRVAKGERGLWQRRYWEHQIRDERDWAQHVEYVHYNPVKHGLVTRPADWPHSSLHSFVREGRLPADWGTGVNTIDGEFGE